jgi:hypothetical protein
VTGLITAVSWRQLPDSDSATDNSITDPAPQTSPGDAIAVSARRAASGAPSSDQFRYFAAAAVIAPLLRKSSTAVLSLAASSGVMAFEPSR